MISHNIINCLYRHVILQREFKVSHQSVLSEKDNPHSSNITLFTQIHNSRYHISKQICNFKTISRKIEGKKIEMTIRQAICIKN